MHDHVFRSDCPLHDVQNVRSDFFLQLQSPANHIGDPGDFGETDNFSGRYVTDRDMQVVHQRHMVLAPAETGDILHDDHVRMIRRETLAEFFRDVFVAQSDSGEDPMISL